MATNPLIFSPTPTPTTTATLTGAVTNTTPLPTAETSDPFATPSNPSPVSAAPASSGTLTPAQMLANQQATVAQSNGMLKLVNGQVVSANSTLGQLSTVPNSPAGSVSSSATGSQLLAGQTAISGTGTAPVTTPSDADTISAGVSSILGMYTGVDPTYIPTAQTITSDINKGIAQGLTVSQAIAMAAPDSSDIATQIGDYKSEQTQLNTQASEFADTNAANAADYASASAILANNQKATTDSVIGALSVGGQASASNVASVTSQVNQQYSYLATQLAATKASEDDAAAAGNDKAVAAIQASYTTLMQDGLKSIANNMDSFVKNVQQDNTLAATKQDAARTQVTSMANSMNLSALVSTNPDGSINNAATMTNIENSPLYAAGQTAGYSDAQLLGLVTTGTITGQNLNINTAKLGISQQQLSVSQFNAQVNSTRAQLEDMTTATTVNTALGAKATQYSGYVNAADGLSSIQQSITSGQAGTTLTDALNSIVKNPASAYANLASALGVNGPAILTAAFGHPPTDSEVQALVKSAGTGPGALNNLISSLGHSVATSIANATAVDSASPVPGMPTSLITSVQSLVPNLQNLAPSSTSSGSSSGFGSYLNSRLGGNYTINI